MTGLWIDVRGDGRPAPTEVRGADLRAVVALRFVPEVAGDFEVQVRASDSAGCQAVTGLRRELRVR